MTLALRNIAKTFSSGIRALLPTDLDIAEGEIVSLLGPSGCGKTTLISIISGILRKDAGVVSVLGKDLDALSDKQRTAWRGHEVGFVFQTLNLVPTLSVQHNVALPLILQGQSPRTAFVRARAILEQVGLADRAEILPNKLSGGQQQRIAIARALVHDPRLLVCDEPTSALDAENGHRVMELLVQVGRRPGRALIVVTHDSRIYSFADRIIRMEDGRVVATESSPSPALKAL
jgi:putative ABC transport system ATP-binding protein